MISCYVFKRNRYIHLEVMANLYFNGEKNLIAMNCMNDPKKCWICPWPFPCNRKKDSCYDKQSLPLILNIKWYFSMTKPGTRWRWELPVQYSGEGEGGEEEGQCPSPNCWPGRTEGCWPGQAWSAPVLASGRQDVGWRVRRGGVRVSTEFLRAFRDLSQPATSYWGGGCSSPLWAKGFFDKSKWDGSKNVCLY